jgi:hypothetical protein
MPHALYHPRHGRLLALNGRACQFVPLVDIDPTKSSVIISLLKSNIDLMNPDLLVDG